MIALLKIKIIIKKTNKQTKKTTSISNQVERKFETHFREFVESGKGLEQGYQDCFADVKVGTH